MDEPTADATFGAYVSADAFERPDASLAELSGDRIEAPRALRTYVAATVETAWDTPLCALTCGQVRMLVSQKLGLTWLAVAVAQFVHGHPSAAINHYPGDLTLSALKVFDDIERIDGASARLLREADCSWMADRYAFDGDLRSEALRLVERAQR